MKKTTETPSRNQMMVCKKVSAKSFLAKALTLLFIHSVSRADVPAMMGSGNLGWDIGYATPPWNDDPSLLDSRAKTIGQVIGLGSVRIGLSVYDFHGNGVMYPERIDNYVKACYKGGITPIIIPNHTAQVPGAINEYNWYNVGRALAERFQPGSNWNVSQGHGYEFGCRIYTTINEPTVFSPNLDKTLYYNALRDFANGVHSINPALKVINGGHLGAEFTYANATSELFNNGTLSGINHHPYAANITYGAGAGQGSPQEHFDYIKRNTTIGDVDCYIDETNFWIPNLTMTQDEAAKLRMTHFWGALGVVGNNDRPVTKLMHAWNPMHNDLDVSSVESYNLGLSTSFHPNWTANAGGRVLQMIAWLTKGMDIISSTPKTTGEMVLSGRSKKMWVWHNRQGWGNKTGTSYTVKDIPKGSTQLKVYRYNSWTQSAGQRGQESPYLTVNLSGQTRYSFSNLPTSETYMFIASGGSIALKAINGKYVTCDLNTPSVSIVAKFATSVQDWEKIQVVDAGNGKVALKSKANGKYLTAYSTSEYTPLYAGWATSINEWEKFDWVSNADNTVSLRAHNGKFVTANLNDSNVPLMAGYANHVLSWEKFIPVSMP
jgi:hypothetical protein